MKERRAFWRAESVVACRVGVAFGLRLGLGLGLGLGVGKEIESKEEMQYLREWLK